MKKLLLTLLTVVLCVGASVASPAPKEKKVKLAPGAEYYGLAVKKTPHGLGTLTLYSCGSISGTFDGLNVTKGKITFNDHEFTLSGNFTIQVLDKNSSYSSDLTKLLNKDFSKFKSLVITIEKARMPRRRILGKVTLVYCAGEFTMSYNTMIFPKLSKELMENIKKFAGEEKYSSRSNGKIKYTIHNEEVKREVAEKATQVKYKFKNGTTATFDLGDGIGKLLRPNGEYISLVRTDNKYVVSNYKLTSANATISKGSLTYRFSNGNTYTGTTKSWDMNTYLEDASLEKLLTFNGLTWAWEEFETYAKEGSIRYADGKTEKVVDGLTETEIARREAERKAKEEAERKAKEEAERKAREEAERQEKLLAQKIASLKKKYPAKFVDALANDTFMADMPYQLFVDFYGASALEMDYTRCGHIGETHFLCYVLNGTHSLHFVSSKLGSFLADWAYNSLE